MKRLAGGRWAGSGEAGGESLDRTRFVVLDLEMTGLDPGRDSIVAIGAVRMTGGRIELGERFEALVRPTTAMRPEAVVVHRITPAEASLGADPVQAVNEFWDWAGDAILAGHCVALDLAFLDRVRDREGRQRPRLGRRVVDTASLYRSIRGARLSALLDGLPMREASLYDMARALGVSVRSGHSALGDAYLTAQVLQRFLAILGSSRGRIGDGPDLGELLARGDPARLAKASAPENGTISF